MIGYKIASIDEDDIVVNDSKYDGTQGLWRLLSYEESPNTDLYD